MTNSQWESSLTETSPDKISIRGYDLADLISRVDFPTALLLLYTGEIPSSSEARVVEALMVASIDHGAGTPSVQAARVAISGGGTLQAASAAGLLAMGDHHGTAVAGCMALISLVAGGDRSHTAEQVVQEIIESGRRVPGYGHRQHKERDPRIESLFAVARREGLPDDHRRAAEQIENALKTVTGNVVPLNIDGAMAAILGDLDFPSDLANALFIASRMVGVMAHAVEEQGMPPMRSIDPSSHIYAGPEARSLPEEE